MHVIDYVILVGWVAFWIYWLAASVGVKAGKTGWTRFAGFRVAAVLLVLLLARAGVFRGHGRLGATSDPWLQGIGLVIFMLGLALAVWARVYLGRNWGMPMSEKADPELVTSGPYRSVRHPIYSGIILGMIGTTIAVSLYWLIAVAMIGAYFTYSAIVEERNMSRLFPDSYPAYMWSTKRMIPFIF